MSQVEEIIFNNNNNNNNLCWTFPYWVTLAIKTHRDRYRSSLPIQHCNGESQNNQKIKDGRIL